MTGIYLTTKLIMDNLDYIKVLRDDIGLNLAIIGFSGQLPQVVNEKSPYDGVPLSDDCLHRLVARHMDGGLVDPLEFDRVRASIGPSVTVGGDDAMFRKCIDTAHQAGCDVWICGGSWTLRRLMFCPSNTLTNDWYESVYCHLASHYGVQGLDITHARFPMGSFPRGLFACTCDACENEANNMGYDMPRMVGSLRSAHQRLRETDMSHLVSGANGGLGPLDILHLLGLDPGLLDWFRFRSALLGHNLGRFREAVQDANPDILFGTDTYPASLSLFMGHNHGDWTNFADFASPLVSHIYQFVSLTLIEWAIFIQEIHPELCERDAMQIVYSITGYDGLGMPESISAYNAHDPKDLAQSIPLTEVILHDLKKARSSLPDQVPSYPILHGSGWPKDAIIEIREGSEKLGHNGIIWQGTDELVDYRLKS